MFEVVTAIISDCPHVGNSALYDKEKIKKVKVKIKANDQPGLTRSK